jgi:UDP-GlcNAc:undecaprenyl-phosphate/decaprenyl-phosphate GlcNAc-1-phosphate transferase
MNLLLTITTAFLVAFSTIPIVIRVFRGLNILDTPDERKVHLVSTPSFGGIGIYLGFAIALLFWVPLLELGQVKFFLLATFFMFLLGLRDDISSLKALDKLTIQVFAALLVVFMADIRLEGFYGLFGLHIMPAGLPEFLTLFVIVGLTNAFNLIDGIDGLAGSLAVIVCTLMGIWFFGIGHSALGVISVSLAASVVAFLFYNWHPSRIFMGDTGSLLIGFMLSCLVIQFIHMDYHLPLNHAFKFRSPVAIGMAVLIVPIYDTFRVFIIRFMAGKSPLAPDNNHIHHVFLGLGFSHSQATVTLILFSLLSIGLSLFCDALGTNWTGFIVIMWAILFGAIFDGLLKRRMASAVKEAA